LARKREGLKEQRKVPPQRLLSVIGDKRRGNQYRFLKPSPHAVEIKKDKVQHHRRQKRSF